MFLVLLTNKVQGWRESKRASVLPGQPTTSRERNKCVDFSQIRSDLTEFIHSWCGKGLERVLTAGWKMINVG